MNPTQATGWAESLARVVTLTNDKGGVGKTTLTANLAGQIAAAGYRVLAIDLNRQANLADDLGYRHEPAVNDDGAGLRNAIMDRRPVAPVSGVRDRLDVVPGGTKLSALTAYILTEMQHSGVRSANAALAAALAPIAGEYDLVLIDTPPENVALGDLALGAARWALMPTKSDGGGLVGMKLTAERFTVAREINPELGLLGVVLFATGTSARAIHAEVRSEVAAAFGGVSPMFQSVVRHSERVARDCRRLGRLAHELEIDFEAQPGWWEPLRTGERRQRLSRTTRSVSADYRQLAAEVLQVLAAGEHAAAAGERMT
jgi:chromosome partitioning protein